MSPVPGPTLISCMKQNGKYAFKGLSSLRSESHEFQSLARDLELPWHQIYYAEHLSDSRGKGDLFLLKWFAAHIFHQSGSGHLRTDLNSLPEDLDLLFQIDRESWPGTDEEYKDVIDRMREIKGDMEGSCPEIIGMNPSIFGSADSSSPFIYLPERKIVYIRRFFTMEKKLLESLETLADAGGTDDPLLPCNIDSAAEKLAGLKDGAVSPEAAMLAKKLLSRRFAILSGGPGTGKTTTITALLRILKVLEDEGTFNSGRIVLAAPTGRAANRMMESLRAVDPLSIPSLKAGTLHKLLGINPARRTVSFNRERPIPAELIILDEASMVDARMMSLLFDGLAPGASLLLVGDRDQLPSVDAGAVFGDFVAHAAGENHKLKDNTLFLTKSWRSSSGILSAAGTVIRGDSEKTLELLRRGASDLKYGELPPPDALIDRIIAEYGLDKKKSTSDPEELLSIFENFTVLIPTRKGPLGVENINRRINFRLTGKDRFFYHGQPVMVLSNDNDQSLFNGDRGVIVRKGGEFLAAFREGSGNFRFIPAGKLGRYETSYCQTVHKSQGSEFDRVLLLIPEGAQRLLTREIVYTGITRARKELTLLSTDELVKEALSRIVVRHSGIREFLGGVDED